MIDSTHAAQQYRLALQTQSPGLIAARWAAYYDSATPFVPIEALEFVAGLAAFAVSQSYRRHGFSVDWK